MNEYIRGFISGLLISAGLAGILHWIVILAKMYVAWEACAAAGGIK